MQLPTTVDARRMYKSYVNGGLLSLLGFMGLDIVEVEAEGWVVKSACGREFIDCLGGYGSLNFGHRHPRITAAVAEQLKKMPLSSKIMLNPQQAALAEELASFAPGELTYSFFSNSGTEAVEAAIKLARLATGKPGIISAINAFHGKSMGSLSSTHREAYQAPFRPLVGHFTSVPFDDLKAIEVALTEETAAVMLEPVQGEGGIIVPGEGYLSLVRKLTEQHGALLIIDEIQTGMGRTGRNLNIEYAGISPDILVLAKSLGGGVMPIGATMGTPEVWCVLEEQPTIHTSTFGGNPLACVAARAALEVLIEEDLAARAEVTGKHFMACLKQLQGEYDDLIKDVRGKGLMIGIEMQSSDISELMIASVVNQDVLIAFALNEPGVIRIEPPLTMPTSVVDEVIERLAKALSDTRQIIMQYSLESEE